MFFAVIFATAVLQTSDARIVIADGAKTAVEAQKKLSAIKVPETIRLAPGYPRVVASDAIEGLNPGLHIVVLGFCSAEESARMKTGETTPGGDVKMNIALRHHGYMLKQLKKTAKGAYIKAVKTDETVDCPLYMFPKSSAKNATVAAAWSAVQAAPKSAPAWVDLGHQLEDDDIEAADYAYSVAYECDPTFAPAQHALTKLAFVGAR